MLREEAIKLRGRCAQGVHDVPWRDFKDFLIVSDVALFERSQNDIHRVSSIIMCCYFSSCLHPDHVPSCIRFSLGMNAAVESSTTSCAV